MSNLPNKAIDAANKGYHPCGAITDGGLRFVSGGLHFAVCVEKGGGIRHIGNVNLKAHFAVFLLAVAFVAGCAKSVPPAAPVATTAPDEPTQAQPKLQTMKFYLGAETIDAELALTPRQEQTGMMYRSNIQETDSMLFVLPYPQQASFWMKHCPESISAAYIKTDGTIAEIHHFEHDDTNAVLSATDDIQFVLETKEGWFTRHNIGVGTLIRSEKGSLPETFLRRN